MKKNRVMHISGQPVRYEGQNTITLKSDTEAHKGAESDPDALPLTIKALAEFKRVNPFVKKK